MDTGTGLSWRRGPYLIEAKAVRVFREEDHPRDREGKFIEKGGRVKHFITGVIGEVLANVDGTHFVVRRADNGKTVTWDRNAINVVENADGSAPTTDRTKAPKALPRDTDAPEAAGALDETVGKLEVSEQLHTDIGDSIDGQVVALESAGDTDRAQGIRAAGDAYREALSNGTPNDEADERAALLAALDDAVAAHPDNQDVTDWSTALREAATAPPESPDTATAPDDAPSGDEPAAAPAPSVPESLPASEQPTAGAPPPSPPSPAVPRALTAEQRARVIQQIAERRAANRLGWTKEWLSEADDEQLRTIADMLRVPVDAPDGPDTSAVTDAEIAAAASRINNGPQNVSLLGLIERGVVTYRTRGRGIDYEGLYVGDRYVHEGQRPSSGVDRAYDIPATGSRRDNATGHNVNTHNGAAVTLTDLGRQLLENARQRDIQDAQAADAAVERQARWDALSEEQRTDLIDRMAALNRPRMTAQVLRFQLGANLVGLADLWKVPLTRDDAPAPVPDPMPTPTPDPVPSREDRVAELQRPALAADAAPMTYDDLMVNGEPDDTLDEVDTRTASPDPEALSVVPQALRAHTQKSLTQGVMYRVGPRGTTQIRGSDDLQPRVDAAVAAASARLGVQLEVTRAGDLWTVTAPDAPGDGTPDGLSDRAKRLVGFLRWKKRIPTSVTKTWPARATSYHGDDKTYMVACDDGHTHYGQDGAAGILIKSGDRYLLQKRSKGVQHGGTWSTPGGALDPGETPFDAARREAGEELGIDPVNLTEVHVSTADHGGWAYHTVVLESPDEFEVTLDQWESDGYAWVTREQMAGMNLHPGFAASYNDVIDGSDTLPKQIAPEAAFTPGNPTDELLPPSPLSWDDLYADAPEPKPKYQGVPAGDEWVQTGKESFVEDLTPGVYFDAGSEIHKVVSVDPNGIGEEYGQYQGYPVAKVAVESSAFSAGTADLEYAPGTLVSIWENTNDAPGAPSAPPAAAAPNASTAPAAAAAPAIPDGYQQLGTVDATNLSIGATVLHPDGTVREVFDLDPGDEPGTGPVLVSWKSPSGPQDEEFEPGTTFPVLGKSSTAGDTPAAVQEALDAAGLDAVPTQWGPADFTTIDEIDPTNVTAGQFVQIEGWDIVLATSDAVETPGGVGQWSFTSLGQDGLGVQIFYGGEGAYLLEPNDATGDESAPAAPAAPDGAPNGPGGGKLDSYNPQDYEPAGTTPYSDLKPGAIVTSGAGQLSVVVSPVEDLDGDGIGSMLMQGEYGQYTSWVGKNDQANVMVPKSTGGTPGGSPAGPTGIPSTNPYDAGVSSTYAEYSDGFAELEDWVAAGDIVPGDWILSSGMAVKVTAVSDKGDGKVTMDVAEANGFDFTFPIDPAQQFVKLEPFEYNAWGNPYIVAGVVNAANVKPGQALVIEGDSIISAMDSVTKSPTGQDVLEYMDEDGNYGTAAINPGQAFIALELAPAKPAANPDAGSAAQKAEAAAPAGTTAAGAVKVGDAVHVDGEDVTVAHVANDPLAAGNVLIGHENGVSSIPGSAVVPDAGTTLPDTGQPHTAEGVAQLTEAQQHAVKQGWKLPTGTVASLQAQLAEVQIKATPAAIELIDQGMDPEKAAKEAKRLASNAKTNYWRARMKLQAAIDTQVQKDQGLVPAVNVADPKALKAKAAKAPAQKVALDAKAEVAAGPVKAADTPAELDDWVAAVDGGPPQTPAALYEVDGAAAPDAPTEAAAAGPVFDPLAPGAVITGADWTGPLSAVTAKDTSPIPVAGVTISGHTVENGWAQKIDGRVFLVEMKPGEAPEEAHARMTTAAGIATKALSYIPENMRVHQRGVALLNAPNPADGHWAATFDAPGFKSHMTAGYGITNVWGGDAPDPATFVHEFGHNVDSQSHLSSTWLSEADTAVVQGQPGSWKQAGSSDTTTSKFYADGRFKETRLGSIPITLAGAGVTNYGAQSPREDFAEAVRLYVKDRREGKVGYDPTTGDNLRFVDLFPARAKVLDAVFGIKSEYNTPVRQKRRAEATAAYKADLKDAYDPETGKFDPAKPLLPVGLYAMKYGLQHDDGTDIATQAKDELKSEHVAAVTAAAQKAAYEAEIAKMKAAEEAANNVKTIEDAFAAGLLSKTERDKLRDRRRVREYHAKKKGIPADQAKKLALDWEAAYIAELVAKHKAANPGGAIQGASAAPSAHAGQKISATLVPANKTAGHKWLISAGVTPHPLAKQKSDSKAPQAKSNIAAALAVRMNNPADWELFRQYMQHSNGDTGHKLTQYGAFDAYTTAQRQSILDTEITGRVQKWAGTSGDTSPAAVMMQMAAADEFGLDAHPAPRVKESDYLMWKTTYYAYPTGAFYRRVAREMYNHTQAEFKAAGITHITMYRGMHFSDTGAYGEPLRPDWANPGAKGGAGKKVRPKLQPINSWSTSLPTAKQFSTGDVVFGADIPVELIVGSARTGFGCLNEYEFVVMDADGEAWVRWTADMKVVID